MVRSAQSNGCMNHTIGREEVRSNLLKMERTQTAKRVITTPKHIHIMNTKKAATLAKNSVVLLIPFAYRGAAAYAPSTWYFTPGKINFLSRKIHSLSFFGKILSCCRYLPWV